VDTEQSVGKVDRAGSERICGTGVSRLPEAEGSSAGASEFRRGWAATSERNSANQWKLRMLVPVGATQF